ncbi:MAG: amidase [bacterium]|nr:amidase [bacterium]
MTTKSRRNAPAKNQNKTSNRNDAPPGSTAAQLARDIQAGRATASQILEERLERIADAQGRLNCFVTIDADGARATARERDLETGRGICRGPLHGVPIALKDSWATRNLRTTNGYAKTAQSAPPDYDATVVARLKAAGAVIVGKTNLSALAMDIQSDNPVAGRTNHPLDPARTPGGSSGGAACAVAAGLVPFDIGSDIGGSIRIPAHFCGVLGFKPTENSVSLHGHLPGLPEPDYVALRHLASAGPIAGSFEDLRLTFDLIRGPDPHDPKIAPVHSFAPANRSKHKRARIAVLHPDRARRQPAPGGASSNALSLSYPIDAEYARRLDAFVEALRRRDREFEVVELKQSPFDFDRIGALWGKLLNAGLAPLTPLPARLAMALIGALRKRKPAGLEQIFPLGFEAFMRTLTERDAAIVDFEGFFAPADFAQDAVDPHGFDALLAPVSATAAFEHTKADRVFGASNVYTQPVNVQGADGAVFPQEYYRAHTGYTIPFNLLGNPVVSMPIGATEAGLPLGIQVIGPRWSDLRLLDLAERLYETGRAGDS